MPTKKTVQKRKKLKIAFILGEFPALSETFIVNQIAYLVRSGHHVEIFSVRKRYEDIINKDVIKYGLLNKTHHLEIPRNKFIRFVKGLKIIFRYIFRHPKKIMEPLRMSRYGKPALTLNPLYFVDAFLDLGRDFDIIHCHFGQRGVYGACLKTVGVKGKLVVSFHGGDVSFPKKKGGKNVYKHLFRVGDLFTTNTPFTKNILTNVGCDPDKIEVLGMGTNVRKFSPKKRKKQGKMFKVLTVGRLAPEKGHKFALRAISMLPKNSKINYKIVGKGITRESLEKLTSSLGINNKVDFTGPLETSELISLYRESDLFILPSISGTKTIEGQGVVLQEAQATRTPVITTNVGGTRYSLVDGETGFIVSEKDPSAIAEKISFFMKNPKESVMMGKRGRKFVEENYDIRKLNEKIINIYRRVLSDK